MKNKFLHYAEKIERKGVGSLLTWLEDSNFYLAPASTSHHLAEDGGLVEHSINVCEIALKLNLMLGQPVEDESVLIASLFHDLGMHQYFGKDYYV